MHFHEWRSSQWIQNQLNVTGQIEGDDEHKLGYKGFRIMGCWLWSTVNQKVNSWLISQPYQKKYIFVYIYKFLWTM